MVPTEECLMFIKMRVIKGIGKSKGKRQSPKGSKTRVCFFGGCGSDKNAVLISKFEVF